MTSFSLVSNGHCLKSFLKTQSFLLLQLITTLFFLTHCFLEPALLEEEEEVVSSVVQNSVKYYKYDLLNKTGIKTVFLQTSHGSAGISVSTSIRNPRNYHVNLGSCEFHGDIKLADGDPLWQLDDLQNSTFCNATSKGGSTEPRFVSDEEFAAEGLIIYVKACSSRWFYVSVEGVNETNTFSLTLFKDLIRITVGCFPFHISFVNSFFFHLTNTQNCFLRKDLIKQTTPAAYFSLYNSLAFSIPRMSIPKTQ